MIKWCMKHMKAFEGRAIGAHKANGCKGPMVTPEEYQKRAKKLTIRGGTRDAANRELAEIEEHVEALRLKRQTLEEEIETCEARIKVAREMIEKIDSLIN